MKKLMYLLLAGLFSTAMISCSDDKNNDNDGDGDGGGGEKEVVYVQPKTLQMIAPGDGPTIKYTYTVADKKITKLTNLLSSGGQDVTTDFTVTYETSKVKVSYENVNEGEVMNIVYTLNAKGFPTTAIKSYSSDGVEAQNYTFEYDAKGMLTAIKDKKYEDEVIFSATYTDTQMNTCMAFGAEYTYKNSTKINNCAIDPTYVFVFGSDDLGGALSIATCLGLIPQSKFLPSAIGSEEGDVNIKTTLTGTSLSEYAMDVDGTVMMTMKYTY